jgi:uncharacterized protein involved in exopolysaccharide biosynthesis
MQQTPIQRLINLPDIIQVIAKRLRMILALTMSAAVISIVYSLFLPNIYTAKTMILPSQEDKGLMSMMLGQLGGLANMAGAVGTPTTTDLYVSILKSEAVKDPIIDRFRLMEVYKNKYRTNTYKILDNNTVVLAGKKDGIITITVDDKEPKRAAEMADAYVDELGKLAIRLNVTSAGQNRSFLEDRLGKAKVDLAKAEENLKIFQGRNKAVQVNAQAEATIKGVAEMRANLALQEVQLATYRRQFTESSQEVKNLVTSVNNLRGQLAKLEGGGGNGAIPSVGSVPAIGQEYVRLMRDFKIQESLVESLTKQYELAKLSEAKDVAPFQVIQKAKAPEWKSKPVRSKIVLTAIFCALVLSITLAFVLEKIAAMPDAERSRWKGAIASLPYGKRWIGCRDRQEAGFANTEKS